MEIFEKFCQAELIYNEDTKKIKIDCKCCGNCINKKIRQRLIYEMIYKIN